jgi:hypothetical protein
MDYKPETKISKQYGTNIVVAVVGYAHDWAAYCAPIGTTVDECSRHGDKISATTARDMFPEFIEMSYRN